MILRGGLKVGQQIFLLATKNQIIPKTTQAVRNSHVVSYRSPPPPHSKMTSIGAEVISAAMWWWVLYHCFTEFDHIIGEFPYPQPKEWTNAELGIPANAN